jgi:hypothetical protein
MNVCPALRADATPPDAMDSTLASNVRHVTVAVTSRVVPSDICAVAVY